MKIAGIICEYNPFHLGHLRHIEKTKEFLGGDAGIVCIMSGNFVQRGDVAIFNKHARAKMAALSGADLVIELPVPYALGSAREFAKAGVHLLDSLGVCSYISFGSECGSVRRLKNAARAIVSDEAEARIKASLDDGMPYASAQQVAADAVLGDEAKLFKTANNTLGIEYIKAIYASKSKLRPMTVRRVGGEHDGNAGYAAAYLRRSLETGTMPVGQMPGGAVAAAMEEMVMGRGPVYLKDLEQAIVARLRSVNDFSQVPGGADGLDRRFLKEAPIAPTVLAMLEGIKTKRFAMSRIRRMMMCAMLGVTNEIAERQPPYIRVLAMNRRGMRILRSAADRAKLPILIKPAAVKKLDEQALDLFSLESLATDIYALAYTREQDRAGGGEWRKSPIVVE